MNSGVNSDIFGQQNKRSRDNRNGSLSAVTSTAGSTPLLTVDKTEVLTKRKLSEDSPQSIKKLRSPFLTPQKGLDFSTLSKRKFGTPQHNKIDKYFMRKEVENFDVCNSKSSCLHENTFESVAHISPNSDEADCVKNCRSHNSVGKTLEHHVPGGEYVVDSVIVLSDDDDDDPVVVSDECDAARSLNEKWDGNIYDLECCDLHDTESTKVTTFVAILSDGNRTKRSHHPNTTCGTKTSAQENMCFTEDAQELKSGKSLQPHVARGKFVVDCVIDISSDDDSNDGDPVVVITDESDAESLTEEREGVGSPDIYDLDSSDLHDIESTEIKTYTSIPPDQSDTKRAHDSDTQNVSCTKASSQGNMHFTCKRKELADSPDLHTVNVKKPVPFDVPGEEQVGSSCSDEPATIKSLTCNSDIFGSPAAEVETVSGPDSEPVFVSDLSEPEVSSSCDDSKPLVVTGSDGNSVVNSKLVIGSMESVSANCVKGNHVLSTNSDEKSLIGCSIPGKELVIKNSPRNEHAFVCSYRKPGATEQLLIAKENVWDPVVVGVCGEKLEVTCEFGKESVVADILDREPTAVDRSIKEPVVVDMSDKGPMNIDNPVTEPSFVNKSVRRNVIVDKPERDLAIVSAPDKGCVIGDQDRKLVVLAEEGSSGEMTMIASHAVSDSTDAGNEEGTSQNTSKINVQDRIGTSGSYDKYPSTSTSAGDGKVGGPVKCNQIIASYQAVMYSHFDRAATRLELRWVPFCCQYSYSCTQQHKSSLWKPSEVCDARSQIMEALMNARQWSCAFHFCCSVTSKRSFPSASTVLRILVFILNSHEICLIGSAVSAFKKIVDLHPPCAPDMLRYYTTVLTGPLIEKTPCLSDNGIVDGIIYELNDIITFKDLQNEDLPCDSLAVCEDPLVTLNTATEELLDVSADERAEANKNYTTLSHDEKLNRLFIVLEVIVELLEIDLSVFLVKHGFQLRKALIHRSYRPLIVSVLWGTNTVQGIGRLNGICRCIIALYAKCFAHNINFNKWIVIARLLALVAETVRASESNDELLYPYFGEQCKTLAREVSQCLSGMNPEELVRVLSEMRPSFLTLYVTNFLLSNAVGYETDPSLNTVVELISTCFLPHDMEALELSPQVKRTSKGEVTETKRIINKRDKKGETILHRVCRKNKAHELKELLKDPDVDVNVMDNFGWTALHEAVHYGAVSCVYELLEYKPPPGRCRTDLHVQSEDGTTPLIDAVQSNQLESCKLLLKYGGPFLLRAKNQDGKSAVDVATSLEMKALLESVGREDKFIGEEAKWQHGTHRALVSQLLPVLLHSYLDTYLTLHIENELKNHIRYDNDDINTLHVKRIGRPKFKFDYPRFSKDYKSLRKLKSRIRDESKKVPGREMIGKFLFLLQ